ncbi:MAG TPA: plasmid recombination protein [Candidatus Enterococcus avicola]|uniref:Plasmid recombination protein n=1 Tax=Candidatus Enterococcus avicola TaxID=2838561 RepID=A0A9D2JJH8_9ENTE|nr:plasmid recombination protein [Candidatus Enterococcus avicola]
MSMSISLKKATNKTNIKHNNRTMSEKEKERNPHIDESRSDENKYLVQKDLKELYQEEFGGALEDYNAKQKRNDRKIDDYYKHIESSKKTSLQQEMIVQVGDSNDFFNSADYEKGNEILLEWFEKFEERNPNLKVYNAVIHNDEASPHLHLNFVPVASEYKRGLEKQVSFDKAITQQDSTLDKTRPFDDWREKEVQLLEKLLVERGIERKLVGTNEYKDVNEYKEKKDLEQEIAFLEGKIDKKKNELVAISEKVPDKNLNLKTKRKETKTEVIQTGLFKKEKVQKETGNYIFTPKQLNELENIVTAAVAVKEDYRRLQGTDLVEENKELREAVYQKTNENFKLEKENQSLKTENRDLKAHISDLRAEFGWLYESAKDFFRERAESVRAFKNDFREFIDVVKKNITGSEFERLHKRELRKEREKGLER